MKCEIRNCDSIICRLKQIFTAISTTSSSIAFDLDFSGILSAIESIYPSEIIIENTLDAIQLFLHSFGHSSQNCLRSPTLLELFASDMSEIYTCDCTNEIHCNLPRDFHYFTINLDCTEDLLEKSFVPIFQKQCLASTYKICKNPQCIYKKSKKLYCSNSSSEYLIFKVNWNQQTITFRNSLISPSFLNKDLFRAEKIEPYNLAVISVISNEQRIIFYRQENSWYNTEDKAEVVLDRMQFKFMNRKFLIEFLLYQRETRKMEPSNSKVSQRVSSSDGFYSRIRVVSPNPEWVCQKCNNKTSIDFKLCTKCRSIKPGETGWVCLRCETYNEKSSNECISCDARIYENNRQSLVDFTHTICPKCSTRVKNGILCKNCSKPPLDAIYRPAMRNTVNGKPMAPQNKCECGENLLAAQMYCLTCCVKVTSKVCPDCKRNCYCKACFDSICKTCKSKLESGVCKKCIRPRSRSSKQKVICYRCSSELQPLEMRNCYKCNKKSSGTVCTNCKANLSSSLRVCDSCMKKNSEPKNKFKSYK